MKRLLLVMAAAIIPSCCFAQDDLSRNDKKKLETRFKIDKYYAEQKRKQYEGSKEIVAYVGEPIQSLRNDWGDPTRVVDNGNGEQLYIYETEVQSSGGSLTSGSISVTSDGYSTTVRETEGSDTRYSHTYITIKEAHVVNNVITHMERYGKFFPEQKRPDAKTIFQKELQASRTSQAALSDKVLKLVKSKGYQLCSKKLYAKKPDEIIYRNFERICTSRECGSELYAVTYVLLEIEGSVIRIKVDQATYSSLIGAEIIMNDLGQVVSKHDEPFSAYSAVSVKGYEIAHPERIYDHNNNIVNRFIYDRINSYFTAYIEELEHAIK